MKWEEAITQSSQMVAIRINDSMRNTKIIHRYPSGHAYTFELIEGLGGQSFYSSDFQDYENHNDWQPLENQWDKFGGERIYSQYDSKMKYEDRNLEEKL